MAPLNAAAIRLPAWRERQLVLAAKTERGPARGDLVQAYEPRIRSVARIYHDTRGVEHAELMQEGAAGLLRALERYDPELGVPFWAYASWWVRQAMQQLVAQLTRPVVLSDRAARQLARVADARRDHLAAHHVEPTIRDLARRTGFTARQVERLLASERPPRSLDGPVEGSDAETILSDLIASPAAEEAYDRVDRRIAAKRLLCLLDGLSERERMIVRGRYGLDGAEQTLRQLGTILGVSEERVRQIEHDALGKLQVAVDPRLTGRQPARSVP